MHIFADLQPYICTFADCEDELAQFPNRAAWAEHEFSQHRITQSWSCPKCPQAFISVSGWQSHIQEKHFLFFSGHNCNVAKDMAHRTEATRIEDEECPLCRIVVGKPRRAFVKHVGRHMEEIALMALPRNVEEDSEEENSKRHSSAASSVVSNSGNVPGAAEAGAGVYSSQAKNLRTSEDDKEHLPASQRPSLPSFLEERQQPISLLSLFSSPAPDTSPSPSPQPSDRSSGSNYSPHRSTTLGEICLVKALGPPSEDHPRVIPLSFHRLSISPPPSILFAISLSRSRSR